MYCRYGNDGKPLECCLLDFQMNRIASPALDMNYMLYCSLNGEVRKSHMTDFFVHYYSSFADVLAASGTVVPFTINDIKKEFYDKNFFGLLMGMILIPIVLMDSDEAPTLDDFKSDNMTEAFEEFQAKIMSITLKSPHLTPRFLSMFDEMTESGLLCKKS